MHRLPRQIGLKPAMGYLLTGRHMPGKRAYELGLVNKVVPAENLDETVEEWVRDILLCSPMAVRATKQAAMRGLDTTLSQAFLSSYEYEIARAKSEDDVEGPQRSPKSGKHYGKVSIKQKAVGIQILL